MVYVFATSMGNGIFLVAIASAPIKAVLFSVFDNYLGCVIDYDQLVSGERRDGAFVAADQIVVAVVQLFVIACAGSILSLGGYRGNGGCECGCGKKCESPYMRWSCPGDIGYACSSALGDDNPPFFGDPTRDVACTYQEPLVRQLLIILFSVIPLASFVVLRIVCARFPITNAVHEDITFQLQNPTDDFIDPVTDRMLQKKSAEQLKREALENTLSHGEVKGLISANSFVQWWRAFVVKTIIVTTALVMVFVAVPLTPSNLRIFAILGATMALVGIIWNALKMSKLVSAQEEFIALFEHHKQTSVKGRLGIEGSETRRQKIRMSSSMKEKLFRWQRRAHRSQQ
jgi:Na+/melibiose symporter-like transporter